MSRFNAEQQEHMRAWGAMMLANHATAYRALIEDGTTTLQLVRLAALRRVHRRRSRR